jgi:hypothetical protein
MSDGAAGSTLYVIQMDIDAALEQDFERWNEEEHVRERLSCPGFLSAARFRLDPQAGPGDPNAPPTAARHLTIYELADSRALRSDEYARRTSNPTAWSRRVVPHLQVRSRGVYVRRQTMNAADL